NEILEIITRGQQFVAFFHDFADLVVVAVTQQDILRERTVSETGVIDQAMGVEDGIGYVNTLAVPLLDSGRAPANVDHRARQTGILEDDVFIELENSAGKHGQATKQVGHQVLRRKPDGNTGRAAKRKQ